MEDSTGRTGTGAAALDDHWRRVEDLYARVSVLGSPERATVLEGQRADAPTVVAEVESLLAAEPPGDEFLSTPWLREPSLSQASLGDRLIGPFRLLDLIGAGGMSVVYRARREEPGFTQQVAIKVITAARWHRGSLAQFRAERQLLASLHHPHIVTLIDGGVTDDGFAYLVMEYLEGLPITSWCREHRVDLRTRLRLFQQVCAAVHYAHRHSVVHRDLKPGNILVTTEGVPKVLDFGTARLLTEVEEKGGSRTSAWLRALTPGYASPEQIRGLPASAADDVYALGVLLFELLAGRVPHDTSDKPLDEVLRLVLDEPPPRPSAVAAAGGPGARPADLKGDLDAIVLKAIDKEPARRYGSAQELADDIGRQMAGQVVVAREPSFTYVVATLARRHRALLAASLVSALAVLAALGVSIVQTRRAVTERDRARAEAAKSQTISRFLGNVFASANPTEAQGPVTARQLLDRGVRSIDTELDDQPDTQIELLLIMADAYERVALEDEAAALLDRVRLRWEAAGNTEHDGMRRALHMVGRLARRQGRPREAIPLLERALALAERLRGAGDHTVALTLRELALARIEAGDGAATPGAMLRRAIAIEERAAPDGATLALLLNNLGLLLSSQGDFAAARPLFEQSKALYAGVTGPARWQRVLPVLSLADMLRLDEDLATAESLFTEALQIDDETYGRESVPSAYTLSRLGDAVTARGELKRGRQLIDEALSIYARLRPADHPDLAAPRVHLARLLVAEGKPGEAAASYAHAVRILEARHGRDHPEVTIVLAEQAALLLDLGGPAAAEPLLRRALEAQRGTLPPRHRALVRTLTTLARTLREQNRGAEAERHAEEAVAIARDSLPARHTARLEAERLVTPHTE